MKTRVALVDDHTSVREMLAALIEDWPEFEVAGQAGTGLAGLALCSRVQPAVLILDLHLPELCGLEILRRVRVAVPAMRVLVYSATTNHQLLIDVLKERPAGFVGKSESLKTLREAVVAVAAGRKYFTPFAAQHLFESRAGSSAALSPRERQILQLIAESGSNKEIAATLQISVKTVDNHRAHLMEKLRLHDVASLTRYAMRNGLVGAE